MTSSDFPDLSGRGHRRITTDPDYPPRYDRPQLEVVNPSNQSWLRRNATFSNILALTALIAYTWVFLFGLRTNALGDIQGISQWWFHRDWSTDDAMQQTFMFHDIFHPGIFKGDIITTMMSSYLPPIHYGLMYVLTCVTHDPIMAGHWIMALQLLLTLGFIYAAVRSRASIAAGLFAMMWMLHTRHIIQRLTGGLPRGWAAPVLTAYVYFVLSGSHVGVLVTLFLGCLLHPPSTLIAALAYGFYLIWKVATPSTRAQFIRPLVIYVALSPLFAFTAYSVTQMAPEIGHMATLAEAEKLPVFSREGGRFPFVPLKDLGLEFHNFAFMSLLSRMYHVAPPIEYGVPIVACLFLVGLGLYGVYRKKPFVSAQIITFGIATLIVYIASRWLAFRLYVPDRHLQFPLGVFFIVGLTIAAWSALHSRARSVTDTSIRYSYLSVIGLCFIATLFFVGSGTGLYGPANFNTYRYQRGGLVDWLKDNTPEKAVIAGHPQTLDPVPLFAMRRAYITYETAHPFYDKYFAAITPRIETSLRAHYAKDLPELYSVLAPAHVDYFVFDRARFYPPALRKAKFFKPFNELVTQLVSGEHGYAYRDLPSTVDLKAAPYMPFKDATTAVVDVAQLGKFLDEQKNHKKFIDI